jgi:hypothetical protein
MDSNILPECFIDTNLIETLVPPRRGYNHQMGCATVAKKMQEKSLNDDFAIGIIDKDKKVYEIDYLKQFEEVVDVGQLILLKHRSKNHYFIQVIPAAEKWILSNAEEVQVSLSEFDLPNDFEQLKSITKVKSSREDDRFRRLFKKLRREKASGIVFLVDWITYLKDHPYDADLSFFQKEIE